VFAIDAELGFLHMRYTARTRSIVWKSDPTTQAAVKALADILARLDAREKQANAAAAEGAVEDARRALDESRARRTLADTQFERYQKLFKSDVISRQEFEIKGTEKELAQQGVARAEARLKQTQEQSTGAGAIADYTRLAAPISVVISSRQADLGATVFPAAAYTKMKSIA
jgi:multidrug resistance efflux pump